MRQSSTASSWQIESRALIAVAALVAVVFYLIVSRVIYTIGFPLDDAWIHLTYARNLAEHGEWAFQLGQRSAGSTAPLWTLLLSIGFFLRLAPYFWTYLLGWLLLTLLAVCAEQLARNLVAAYKSRIPWAGLFFVFAWHLTWSAVSGMETLLHGLLILVVLGALLTRSRRYLEMGVLAGLSIWVRPDGLTLLGPTLLMVLLSEESWRLRTQAVGKILLGFGSLLIPYLLFNLALSGNPLPNTFYAKQAEYQAYWSSMPLSARVTSYLWPILASAFLVLIPAAVWWLVRSIRNRNWGSLASLIWFVGYVGLYFFRLPAYQHGRYIIPAFPILYLWGVLGFLELTSSPKLNSYLIASWRILTLILVLTFQFIGARQNAYDVFLIESEMVRTARWVQESLPADAKLAVHDIGVLGFYVPNPLVDLAGLTSPEVIPFIRDEARLADYLDANQVDYLITFPSFYPRLTSQGHSVFEAGIKTGPVRFEENIQVYRWR